jgi:hypothetical protein
VSQQQGPPDPTRAPAFAEVTLLDRAVRFACGGIAGAGVVLVLLQAADVFGEAAMKALGVGVPLLCGLLAMIGGDRFFETLATVTDWRHPRGR